MTQPRACRDALGDGLVEADRPHDVAQPMRSQVEKRESGRHLSDEPDRRV